MQRAPARQDCEKMIVVLIVGLFATWICRQMMVMMVIVVVRVYATFWLLTQVMSMKSNAGIGILYRGSSFYAAEAGFFGHIL